MIGWVFPGQGSQFVGMGAGLSGDAARETFARARGVLGWDVRSACVEGSERVLGATEVAQPAILTVSVAVAETLQRAGSFPDAVGGHSVGEFAALVAAHAISFEDALGAVAARAEAMARSGREHPGGMAAILGLSPEDVEGLCRTCGGAVGIASINAPTQVVVSGERDAVAMVVEMARAAGARRVVPLEVSVAAHSSLMAPAGSALRRALGGVGLLAPIVPFVSCVSGRLESDPARIADLLCGAVTRPVRWVDALGALRAAGVDRFFEVGPGRVLTGLVRSVLRDVEVLSVGDDAAISGVTAAMTGTRAR